MSMLGLLCYSFLLIRVIDGDTIVLNLDLGLQTVLQEQHVRLMGVDTPEIRGPERLEGLVVKTALESLLADGEDQKACVEGRDSFGRILAHVYTDDIYTTDWLLDNNFANPYRAVPIRGTR